jgi:predicted phosphodiesterase
MRIAVIGDLHANLPALMAVLEDARALGCDAVWCVGDVVGRGPHPGEVVDELRRLRVLTAQGNWDEAVGLHREQAGVPWASPQDELDGTASLAWTIARTTEEQRTWLRQLPATHRVEAEGRSVLLFHGSPQRQTDYLWSDRPSRVFARISSDQGDDLLCFGNTHEMQHRIMGRSHFVAAGSVGCGSLDDPNADYAVVDMTSAELAVTFRSVPYDYPAVEAAMRAAGLAPSLLWMPPALHGEPEAEAEQLVEV